ncbi:MAG: hypothetical protein U0586_04405 [Candidatus Brocadiaceae bacterium]
MRKLLFWVNFHNPISSYQDVKFVYEGKIASLHLSVRDPACRAAAQAGCTHRLAKTTCCAPSKRIENLTLTGLCHREGLFRSRDAKILRLYSFHKRIGCGCAALCNCFYL